ncbi:MAG TPA: ADOP family duplicated permease [Thermoanaerobaculia bacterium]|nr:ADOP family duplicated permease [Thermoanaerobaculia bacterium]
MSPWRLALRTLRRRPSFVLTVLLTLGIALTALAVTFGVADPVLFRPLPFHDPDRLVVIQERDRRAPGEAKLVSPADFHDVAALEPFDSSAAWMNWNFNLTGRGLPRRLVGSLVSERFFSTLGAAALHGRTFEPADARPGAQSGVVISHRLWREVLGSDPAVVGTTIALGGDPVEVIGVMPASFHFPDENVDVWTPLVFGVHFQPDDRGGRNLRMISRLRDGGEEAQRRLDVLAAGLSADSARTHEGWSIVAVPLHESLAGEVRPMLLLFAGATALLLAIAVANTTNLLLMLAASRRREIATQSAIGAGAGRMVLETLAQAALLGLTAAALSLAAAAALLPLVSAIGIELPYPVRLALDARLFAFTLAMAAIATGVAAAPAALLVLRTPLARALHERDAGSRAGGRVRRILVVAQIAIACTLLVGAALFGRSLARLAAVDPGFEPRNLVTARTWLPRSYETSAQHAAFFDEVLSRIGRLPGVESAAAIQDLPLGRNTMRFEVEVEGRDEPQEAAWRVVSDGYFETMQIPLHRGRGFGPLDRADAPRVAIVNRTLAIRTFGAEDPIGRRIRVGGDGAWATVVGIAGDVRHRGLVEEELPAVYEPLAQKDRDFLRWMTLTVRTAAAPSPSIAAAIREAVAEVDPAQPVYEIATMEELLRAQTAGARVAAILVGAVGTTALIIALVGISGVLSYGVALRRRELGIRAALGATPRALLALVLLEALALGAAGAAIGLLLTTSASSRLDPLLFDTSLVEPALLALVIALVMMLSLAAAAAPARRASRLDPARVLREE